MFKSTNRFIVTPKGGSTFVNEKIINGKTIIVNTSIEHANDSNRSAIVKSLPLEYTGNVRVGDEIIVQHNIFRDYFDCKGFTRKSDFHIKDNLFYVVPELVYLIIRNGKKISVDNYCFVTPIIEEKKWIGNVEVEHIGILRFDNEYLSSIGVKAGDKIAFHNDCEYEFNIDNERLYRMKTKRILAKLE